MHCGKFYKSKKGSVVPKDMSIIEKDGYVPFGEGYRRCPGEGLSMSYLRILVEIVSKLDISLENYNPKILNKRFGFGIFNGSVVINIKTYC